VTVRGWLTLYFCPYLRQLITDFQNFSTVTLHGQFAIMWLLYIPPYRKCVFALPCEIWIKYACITIMANKHFVKIEKKTHLRPTLQWIVCMTLDCVCITQSSVIQTIHRNVGLKCFFHLPQGLLLSLGFLTFMFYKIV